MKPLPTIITLCCCLLQARAADLSYPIVDTGQTSCYDLRRAISYPSKGGAFDGQDAQYMTQSPSYRDNGDGTVSDLVTGLMWSQAVDTHKLDLDQAEAAAKKLRLGGHADWRVPNIKELYSLIDFRGYTGFAGRDMSSVPANAIPYINSDIFVFRYGDTSHERYMDAQWLSSTRYVSTTMHGNATVFGVNFADGRIKGYPDSSRGGKPKGFYVRYVRGNPAYGINDFHDNGDDTIEDRATGLQWMRIDSGRAMSWQEALAYAESLSFAGHDDWRLPDAKELQSIVDYHRSPDTSDSAAIDPIFSCTAIENEAGQRDFPWYWTSTTHLDGPQPGSHAAYLAFGRAIGQMHGQIMDVHGAGAQRSDPKTGAAGLGHGPQGDARRVVNFVRCVRGGSAHRRDTAPAPEQDSYPLVITIAGQEATAHEPASSPVGPFVRRLDKDGDGRVSRQEFDGPANRFDNHDVNKDGYLSEDEAPQRKR